MNHKKELLRGLWVERDPDLENCPYVATPLPLPQNFTPLIHGFGSRVQW